MNNMKKFFAFSIATAMVAGAVCAVTPGFKSLAEDTKRYWWNGDNYVDVYDSDPKYNYTEVWKLPGEGNTYVDFNFNNLSLSAQKNEVNVNGELRVDLNGCPDSSDVIINCESDDSSVAKVSSTYHSAFYVKGIKAGIANISCTVIYKGTKLPTLETSITVIDPNKIQSVEINDYQSVIMLMPGYTYQVSTTVLPSTASEKVVWSSSDESVVEIRDGVVYARNPGKATITVASESNPEICDSIDIEVGDNVVDVSITPKDLTLYVGEYGEATATLKSKSSLIEIKDFTDVPTDYISFKSSDESVAYISGFAIEDGKLKLEIGGYKPGTASISLGVTDYNDWFKVNSDAIKVTVRTESSKQNATPSNGPTAEAQAKQEQTPESIANYQKWLATYGGGTAAAAGTTTVSGTIGQPGSEAIVNTASGAPVAMFQSNDATNTLLAAPVGVVPSGTKIETVEAGKDSAAFKAAQNRLSSVSRRGTVQKVYGITGLNADGSQITTLNGKAAMSMPLPTDVTVPAGRALKVYLIPDNGQPTKLDTLIDQGRVVFEIPKFGTFAFVVE